MYCIVSDCFLINYSNEKIPLKIEEPHQLWTLSLNQAEVVSDLIWFGSTWLLLVSRFSRYFFLENLFI